MSFTEMIEANIEQEHYFCLNRECYEVTTIFHAGISIGFCPSCGERYPHKISNEELIDEHQFQENGTTIDDLPF